jgi:nicotinamide mononucleotide transporter
MVFSQIVNQFLSDIALTKWQEWLSTLAQVLSVWYARKNNILVYPTGIVGVVLAAYIYYCIASPPLYADALLNVYYFAMSLYGWYNWSLKKEAGMVYPISWCTHKDRVNGLLMFIAFWFIIYIVLIRLTDSNTPILDALVSSSAFTAMYWMAKRKIENWHAWIFSNCIAIPLNFYKGFMLFTLMYVLFLGMAWMGYKTWKKEVVL